MNAEGRKFFTELLVQKYNELDFSKTPPSFSETSIDISNRQNKPHFKSHRFIDNRNGTVTDNATGLIWLKNADRLGMISWDDALKACGNLSDDSTTLTDGSKAGDWRLPGKKELLSLIDYNYRDPALSNGTGKAMWKENDIFKNVKPRYYWTSNEYSAEKAWYLDLGCGNVFFFYKANSYNIWPVRENNIANDDLII